MASKPKINPLTGTHTAGIFSDLTIDGPIIGTLVLVVDRAKNLPNRKTIGKQDPYCAARLGKEAKKTSTDIRGGQTPRWDQELRFAVHDSPDYYQLKVSTFSDDKKTELIGENWIDLRDIIVAGGGQSDQWHTLNYRGKYAGEIRIEITYYDSRPKMEKPAAPASMSATAAVGASSLRSRAGGEAGGSGTMGPRAPNGPKRRPLPSDPVTGLPAQPQPQPVVQASAALPIPPTPQAVPVATQQQRIDLIQTPPRPQPNPPSTYTPNQSPLPPVNYSNTPPQAALYQQQPQQQKMSHPQSGSPAPPARYQNYSDQDTYMTGLDSNYDTGPPVQHSQQYQNHQSRHSQHSHHSHSHDKQYTGRDFTPDVQDYQLQPYSRQEDTRDFNATSGSAAHALSTTPSMASSYDDTSFVQPVDDRPPPPPAHRSRNNSSGAVATDAMFRTSVDSMQATMRREVLRNEAHRNSISTAYPGRPTYRPLDSSAPPPAPVPEPSYQPSPPRHNGYDASYEGQYSGDYDRGNEVASALVQSSFCKSATRPPPPPPSQQQQQHQEQNGNVYNMPGLDKAPSPAPLNIGAHRSSFSASPAPMYGSTTHTQQQSQSSGYMRRSPSPMVPADYNRKSPIPQPMPEAVVPYSAYDHRDDAYQRRSAEPDSSRYRESSEPYTIPPVPSSLVPGVDPSLAVELRSRIHEDEWRTEQQKRYTLSSQPVMDTPAKATPSRGRQMMEDTTRSSFDYDNASQPYTPQRSQLPQSYSTPPQPVPQPQSSRYDRSPGPYASDVASPAGVAQRGASPNLHHTIKRKSVSPAPPAPSESERRLSGIPFGPDSYDELNPTVLASKDAVRPDYDEATGKIISHDGKEIDPSDHLPMDTWAPEPEPKPSKPGSVAVSPAAYTTPSSGRKQLRVAGRPQSSMGSSGVTFSSADDPGTTYTPTARNRLQKKANRQSVAAMPVSSGALPSGSPQASTPLAPLTYPRQQQDNFTPPRPLARASTYDYSNENSAPTLYGSSPGRTSFGGTAPPIPAKVPVVGASGSPYGGASHTNSYRGGRNSYGGGSAGSFRDGDGDVSPVMSGALQNFGPVTRTLPWNDSGIGAGAGGNSAEMALMEEMSRIDIGAGRARRHRG